MTDPIAEALDVFVPAFVSVDGDWQGVLQAAVNPAAVGPAHRQPSLARSGTQPRRLWPRIASSNRTKVLGIAVAAAAAALIAFLAVPGTNPHRSGTTKVPTWSRVPATPLPIDQALKLASSSFGVPVNLPDTRVFKPSDATTGWAQWLESNKPGEEAPLAQLDVQYRPPTTGTPNVNIEYVPTAYTVCGSEDASCSSVYPDALDQYKAEIAQASTQTGTLEIVYLSDGTPALIATSDDKSQSNIHFRLGPLSIGIGVRSNDGAPTNVGAADLQALAQSIVGQAPTSP